MDAPSASPSLLFLAADMKQSNRLLFMGFFPEMPVFISFDKIYLPDGSWQQFSELHISLIGCSFWLKTQGVCFAELRALSSPEWELQGEFVKHERFELGPRSTVPELPGKFQESTFLSKVPTDP